MSSRCVHRALAAVAVALVLLGVPAGGEANWEGVYRLAEAAGGEVVVPDLRGKHVAQLQDILGRLGLRHQLSGGVPTRDLQQNNYVAFHVPGPNMPVPRGTVITITPYAADRYPISQVRVPGVTGLHVSRASAVLVRLPLGLRVHAFVDTGDRSRADFVVSQNPGPNTAINSASLIWLTLYRYAPGAVAPAPAPGPPAPAQAQLPPPQMPAAETVAVPNLMQFPPFQASDALSRVGLRPQYVGATVSGYGTLWYKVARQSVNPGARVSRGTVVQIHVFVPQGNILPLPPPSGRVTVPNMVGRTEAEAQTLLSQAGLRKDFLPSVATRDRKLAGRVASQNPAAGQSHPWSGSVRFGIYCADIILPNVLGSTQTRAIEGLRRLGLVVNSVIGQVRGHSTQANMIATQYPPAGACVTRGSTVRLTLYRTTP